MMEQDKDLQVIVAGHICIDLIPTFKTSAKSELKDILIPGKLINMGRVNISTGGIVSNTGQALMALGIRTKLMGKIGNDFFGEGILSLLRRRGAHEGMIVVDGEETSYTVVLVLPGFDRLFLHNPGANDTFCADDIDYGLVSQAKLFHFGYPPLMKKMFENDGEELIRIFKKVKELGVTTSLDMSLPDPNSEAGKANWDKILKNLLPYVDIYMPSIEETLLMLLPEEFFNLNKKYAGKDTLEHFDVNLLPVLGDKLVSYGAKVSVIKCGVKGYYLRTQGRDKLSAMGMAKPADIDNWSDRELLEESFHVDNVVSTLGAGDCSVAGFLAAFLNGRTVEDSIRIACAVGAQNVQVPDAVSGVKSWDETIAMINESWAKNRLSVAGRYWNYDDGRRIWVGNSDRSR